MRADCPLSGTCWTLWALARHQCPVFSLSWSSIPSSPSRLLVFIKFYLIFRFLCASPTPRCLYGMSLCMLILTYVDPLVCAGVCGTWHCCQDLFYIACYVIHWSRASQWNPELAHTASFISKMVWLLELQASCHTIHVMCWDWNSCLHVCVARALFSEPSH